MCVNVLCLFAFLLHQSPDMSGLVPHVSAPGACVPVMRMAARQSSLESGTSVAAPFVAGCLALWLQQKQQQAAALGQPLNPQLVSQEAASKALVITATPIVDEDNPRFLEPVAHAGSGGLEVQS
jgi:subtilase family serine protease